MQVATKEAFDLLLQGSQVLATMETSGIRVDESYLDQTITQTGNRMQELEIGLKSDALFTDWQKKYGIKTKLGSRSQLASMLFDELQIPYEYTKTATGRYRADEEVLKSIDLPFVQNWRRLEELRKFKSTFLDGLKEELVDGYVHPVFNLHTVSSFRSSANSPNIQNQPVRDAEFGPLLRRCFIPRKGRLFVEVDYVALEVRISACYNKDPVLLEYINDPSKDMHRDMAAECFCLPVESIDKQLRYVAKNQFVFPQFYGSYYVDCARNMWNSLQGVDIQGDGVRLISLKKHLRSVGIRALGICDPQQQPRPGTFENHIKNVQDNFWQKRFRIYDQWKRDWYAAYLRTGSFRMLSGFIAQGVYKRNEVINLPVQGAAFHCLLWSLIEIQQELKKQRLRSKLVAEIHDSLLADVPEEEVDDFLRLTSEVMTKRLLQQWPWIICPLAVEVEVSAVSWADKQPWQQHGGQWQPKE